MTRSYHNLFQRFQAWARQVIEMHLPRGRNVYRDRSPGWDNGSKSR